MTPRFIARQLSRPSGFLGLVIGRLMNRNNAQMNTFALRQLGLTSGDRVLEIGFGGGLMLAPLNDRAAFVGGVDRSELMVRRANARFRDAIRGGRADFREGTVEAIPFQAASFTKVCTVNTVYFWKSLDAGFARIHRVLSPGGRLAVGFRTKEQMDHRGLPADIFTPPTDQSVIDSLLRSGFGDLRVERPQPTTPWSVVLASR
jgi:ubiquinone/menaquinone biosynthesis C-methylase UbiE